MNGTTKQDEIFNNRPSKDAGWFTASMPRPNSLNASWLVTIAMAIVIVILKNNLCMYK